MFNRIVFFKFKIGLSLFGCAEKYTLQNAHSALFQSLTLFSLLPTNFYRSHLSLIKHIFRHSCHNSEIKGTLNPSRGHIVTYMETTWPPYNVMHYRDILNIHFFQTEPSSEVSPGSSLENMSQPTHQFRIRSSLEL